MAYAYSAVDALSEDWNQTKKLHPTCTMYLPIFKVNQTSAYIPFLTFYLNEINNSWSIPEIKPFQWDSNLTHIQGEKYRGFYYCKISNSIYLFCEASVNSITNSRGCFSLIREIINDKQIKGNTVLPDTTRFFIFNPSFCFLTNERNQKYELPVVGFKKIDAFRTNVFLDLGIHQGMSTYHMDINKLQEDDSTNTNIDHPQYIMRFALFLGKMVVRMGVDNEEDNFQFNNSEFINRTYLILPCTNPKLQQVRQVPLS
jgi:hypothetical protein